MRFAGIAVFPEKWRLAGNPLTVEEYGILMGKKKPDMQKAMDKALDNLKRNGTYDKLYEKWFGKGEK